jgi:ABC-type transporter Mla MlaB component
MLRVSDLGEGCEGAVLRLEGEMIGPWIGVVKKACEPFVGHGLTLDLTDLSHADRDGVALLKELVSLKVRLINCSAFLTEQLKAES